MKVKPKFRVGQKVIVSDLRSREHGREPDRYEGQGIVRDLFSPHGRQTSKKDKTSPYFIETEDGNSSWYDEDEVEKSGSCSLEDNFVWEMTPIEPTPSNLLWKRPMSLACPHGLEFYVVDGTYVRNHYDSDWVQGGNGARYRFCPKRELWIDESIPDDEVEYVALHECYETNLMLEKGYSHDRAHDCAKRLENKFRRQNRPGEGRYT